MLEQDSYFTRSHAGSLGFKFPFGFLDMFPKEKAPHKSSAGIKRQLREDGSSINPFAAPLDDKKSAVFMPPTVFSPASTAKFHSKIENIPGARLGCNFSTPSPASKKPKSAFTPSGTELSERIDFGPFALYSQGESSDEKIPEVGSQQQDEIMTLLAEGLLEIKEFSHTVTKEGLEEIRTQARSSQQAVAGGKAVDSAKKSGAKIGKEKWHWMHLVAFFMLGKKSQDINNLVAGVDQANYRHLSVELEVPYLLQFFPEGIKIDAKAMVDGNNVAQSLDYKITTPAFEVSFKIDPQARKRAEQIEGEYVHSFMQTLVERSQEKKSFAARLAADSEAEYDCGV